MLLTTLYPHRRIPFKGGFAPSMDTDIEFVDNYRFLRSTDGTHYSGSTTKYSRDIKVVYDKLSQSESQLLAKIYDRRKKLPIIGIINGKLGTFVMVEHPSIELQPGGYYRAELHLIEVFSRV